jgi:hypothetical protein
MDGVFAWNHRDIRVGPASWRHWIHLLLENQKETDSGDEPTLTVGMGSKQKTDSFVTVKESCIYSDGFVGL